MPGVDGQANARSNAWRSRPQWRLHAGKDSILCAMNMTTMTKHDIPQQPGLFAEGRSEEAHV